MSKKGYEDRAKFITNELSQALGIEIEYKDGIIQGYQQIQEEIDKTIEKKKAEAEAKKLRDEKALKQRSIMPKHDFSKDKDMSSKLTETIPDEAAKDKAKTPKKTNQRSRWNPFRKKNPELCAPGLFIINVSLFLLCPFAVCVKMTN